VCKKCARSINANANVATGEHPKSTSKKKKKKKKKKRKGGKKGIQEAARKAELTTLTLHRSFLALGQDFTQFTVLMHRHNDVTSALFTIAKKGQKVRLLP